VVLFSVFFKYPEVVVFFIKKPNNHPTLVHTSSRTGQRTGQEPIQKILVFNADYQVTQKLGYVELDFWELD
jgi:hypothetical protein